MTSIQFSPGSRDQSNSAASLRSLISHILLERSPPAATKLKKKSDPPAPSTNGPESYTRRKQIVMPPTGMWVKWNARNPFPYASNNRDQGPGELRLTWELGGQLSKAHTAGIDVIDQNGNKWEVKAPDDGNMIRPGVEGRRALSHVKKALDDVCHELINGFNIIDFEALEHYAQDAPLDLSDVAQFIAHDVPMIISGEISVGRIMGGTRVNPIGLLQILEFVKYMIGDATKAPSREVAWGSLTKVVDIGTYVHASRILGIDDAEIDASVHELFAGTFRHPAFRKPRTFIKDVWSNGVLPSMVFPGVSGVIVVNPTHFMIVPQDELDVYFKFMYVSKGEPRFLVRD